MAKRKTTTKSRRRPQPAKAATRTLKWAEMGPAKRDLVKIIWALSEDRCRLMRYSAQHYLDEQRGEQAIAELAALKANCAIIPAKMAKAKDLKPLRSRS